MGQKVSPIGFRTGVTIGWKSRWFAPKSNFGEFLVEDEKIRRYIDQRLNRQPPHAAVSDIEIERTSEELKVLIRTARPGLVIGPKGAEVDKLKASLEEMTDRRVGINIIEIRNPDLDAKLVAEGIAEQLKRRASFRRTIKQRAEGSMQSGAKGVKVIVSGRLGGAEMSRTESVVMGSVPLTTLEADVDYGFATSFTTYGAIGVKVWIYRGMFGEKTNEEDQNLAAEAMTRARRRRERRPDSGGGRGGRGSGGAPASGVRPGGSRLGGRMRAEQQAPPPERTEPAQHGPGETAPPAAPQEPDASQQ